MFMPRIALLGDSNADCKARMMVDRESLNERVCAVREK